MIIQFISIVHSVKSINLLKSLRNKDNSIMAAIRVEFILKLDFVEKNFLLLYYH